MAYHLSKITTNKEGFTLIELLVVIAIISLLASVVLGSLNSARDRAVSVKAVAQVNQIATALELYYDKFGEYPLTDSYGENSGWCDWDMGEADGDGDSIYFVDPLVDEGFIPSSFRTQPFEDPYYLYTGDASNNLGGADCACASAGTAVVVVKNLPVALAGVTDVDKCDDVSLWNASNCSGEISPTAYCRLLTP